MSSHYKTQESLSPELIDKTIRSRYINVGLYYLRQLFFAKFDLKVHVDKEAADYTKLWNDLRESISLVKGGKALPGQGTFGHVCDSIQEGSVEPCFG
jgi:Zn-dependent oligopeptidase